MNITRIIFVFVLVTLSGAAFAGPITGVTVTTTFTSPGDGDSLIANIVNGSGLSSYTADATHFRGFPDNAWASTLDGVSTGVITFDLGDLFTLDGMAVWNFNAVSEFGIKDLTIESSLDGVDYALIGGAPTQFAIGAEFDSELAQVFSYSSTARFVRFNVLSSHGLQGIGMSEVMFLGEPGNTVPVPATLALVCVALAAMRRFGHRQS